MARRDEALAAWQALEPKAAIRSRRMPSPRQPAGRAHRRAFLGSAIFVYDDALDTRIAAGRLRPNFHRIDIIERQRNVDLGPADW
jgi:hypothetical protein